MRCLRAKLSKHVGIVASIEAISCVSWYAETTGGPLVGGAHNGHAWRIKNNEKRRRIENIKSSYLQLILWMAQPSY